MTLEEHINRLTVLQIHSYLKELLDRRESELRPATFYLKNTPERQLLHVHSEIYEVIDAIEKLENHKTEAEWRQLLCNLADEIYDAQSSLTTLAFICGLNREDMVAAGKRKVKVNAERGYYNDND